VRAFFVVASKRGRNLCIMRDREKGRETERKRGGRHREV
jgi:hypothetical protein